MKNNGMQGLYARLNRGVHLLSIYIKCNSMQGLYD